MEISIAYLAGTPNPALDALLREDAVGRVSAAEAEAAWFYADRPMEGECLAIVPPEDGEEAIAAEAAPPPGEVNLEDPPLLTPDLIIPPEVEDEISTPGPPGDVALSFHKRVLEASEPSPGVLSILYTVVRDYFLVNNPSFDYWSAIYDVSEARLLTIDDLFPDRALSLPLFWNAAAQAFCQAAGSPGAALPAFYGYRGSCPGPDSEEPLELPEALRSSDLTLPDLGFPLLTPEGLVLHLNPYQGWGLAMGPAKVTIGIGALREMGANMALWGR
jgi:hypothetical protein